jgi:hypothetical protein
MRVLRTIQAGYSHPSNRQHTTDVPRGRPSGRFQHKCVPEVGKGRRGPCHSAAATPNRQVPQPVPVPASGDHLETTWRPLGIPGTRGDPGRLPACALFGLGCWQRRTTSYYYQGIQGRMAHMVYNHVLSSHISSDFLLPDPNSKALSLHSLVTKPSVSCTLVQQPAISVSA